VLEAVLVAALYEAKVVVASGGLVALEELVGVKLEASDAIVGVIVILVAAVVVAANETEWCPEDETVLELAPWLEAGGTLVLEAPAVTVLGTSEVAAASAPIGIVEAVEVVGTGFWGVPLPPRFGIPRPTPSVRSWAEVWFNPAKVWSSPEKSKFACDWSKAADSSRGDFAAGEPYSDELVLEDESWPSAGSP
jgi:hypothetical protein